LARDLVTGAIVATLLAAGARGDPGEEHADLHARYAQARARLAEARLEKAEQLVGKTPGLLTESDVRRLRTRVDVLRGAVATARDRPHGHSLAVQRAVARATNRIADEDLAAARAVRQRQPAAMPAVDLRQFEIKAEIAALRATLLDDPAFLESPFDVLQLQIDQLTDMILDSTDRIDAAPGLDRR
jgi:hypothetical protein